MQQPSNRIIVLTVIMIFLTLYSLRTHEWFTTPEIFFCILAAKTEVHYDDTSISLCQVHVQYDALDDRTILSLLAVLKMHDFQIGQPVWGPSDTLLYLCEHRLKTGLKQATVDQELNAVIKNSGSTGKRFAWSCA